MASATSVQDVPRSTDHAPSKTFYTFRANTDSAFRVMQHDIVQALLNLRLRHRHERGKAEDVRLSPQCLPYLHVRFVAPLCVWASHGCKRGYSSSMMSHWESCDALQLLRMLQRREVQHELYQQADVREQVERLQQNEQLIASQGLRLVQSLQLFAFS